MACVVVSLKMVRVQKILQGAYHAQRLNLRTSAAQKMFKVILGLLKFVYTFAIILVLTKQKGWIK
jgi:hypothetical protein